MKHSFSPAAQKVVNEILTELRPLQHRLNRFLQYVIEEQGLNGVWSMVEDGSGLVSDSDSKEVAEDGR